MPVKLKLGAREPSGSVLGSSAASAGMIVESNRAIRLDDFTEEN